MFFSFNTCKKCKCLVLNFENNYAMKMHEMIIFMNNQTVLEDLENYLSRDNECLYCSDMNLCQGKLNYEIILKVNDALLKFKKACVYL